MSELSELDVRPAVATPRLVLRALAPGDALMLVDFAADIGVAGATDKLPHPFGVAEAEACLAKASAGDKRIGFVVEHRQFGPIGMLGFREREPRRPELRMWLGRPFWNRGYGGEAVAGALDWAQHDWGRKVVWAGHFADNRAAGALLVKSGFLYTGDVEVRPSRAREGAGLGGEGVRTRMMVWLA
jgi:RimJ/RimL family protein N-acetyltransferase